MKAIGRVALSCVAIVLMSCCVKPRADSLTNAYRDLVVALGDPGLSFDDRRTALRMLIESNNISVIPVLIEALEDSRIYNPKALTPGSPAGGEIYYIETVGMASERILYAIILGGEQQRHFKVKDWHQWWKSHQLMSFDKMCNEATEQNGR